MPLFDHCSGHYVRVSVVVKGRRTEVVEFARNAEFLEREKETQTFEPDSNSWSVGAREDGNILYMEGILCWPLDSSFPKKLHYK